MHPQTAKTKGVRHQKIAPRPTPSAPSPLAAIPSSQSNTPLPPRLTNRMASLIHLSRQIQSLVQGLSYRLFSTAKEWRDAQAHMADLRNTHTICQAQIDEELIHLGYLPSSFRPAYPAASKRPPKLLTDVANTKGPRTGGGKHKYGPTSPRYTVDKALKRKADKQASTLMSARPGKKRKYVADSDYVESDYESGYGWRGGRESIEEDTAPPPQAITCLAKIPLPKKVDERLRAWTWAAATANGGCGRQVVYSPLGARDRMLW